MIVRIFRNSLLILLLASVVPPSVHAIESQESAISWRTQSDDFIDGGFSSGFELFYAGPEWFLNALSNPRSRNPFVKSFLDDSAGDRLGVENGYVGTLHDVFDVSLFNNISTFGGGASTGKTSTTTVLDAGQGTLYWDTAAGAGNDVGGSATWSAQTDLRWSTTSTGDATLTDAATTDAGIFQGTAGTITIGAFNPTLASWTFNTTNYILTTNTSATNRTLTGPFALAANVNLNFGTAADTTTRQMTIVGSVSGSSGSTLTIQGSQASSATSGGFRLNLGGTNNTISVPIVINQSGTGIAGVVATGTGEQITGTITNNGTGATMLGASIGASDLTVSGIISGSANLRFQGGVGTDSTGSGTVTLTVQNNYTGATIINMGSLGTVKLGITDAFTTTTALKFGATSTSGNVGTLDMNGKSQTVASLESVTTGTHSISNASGTLSTLTINGSATTTYTGTIGATSANNIALVRSGSGKTILSGNNTYTGTTNISGTSTLEVANDSSTTAGRIGSTARITVDSGGTLLLSGAGSADRINNAAPITLTNGGTFKLNGVSEGSTAAAGVGALTLTSSGVIDLASTSLLHLAASGGQTWTGTLSIWNWSGTLVTGGGTEQLLFGTDTTTASLTQAQLNSISFYSDSGTTFLGAGAWATSNNGEVVPIPEPSTWIGGALALGAVGLMSRKRLAKRLRVTG